MKLSVLFTEFIPSPTWATTSDISSGRLDVILLSSVPNFFLYLRLDQNASSYVPWTMI